MFSWKAVIFISLYKTVCPLPHTNVENASRNTLSSCEEGWKRYDQHCFKLEKEHLNWNNASEKCISMGGHLASIHSKEQNDFFGGFTKEAEKTYWWIGLYDVEITYIDPKFAWADGTGVDYTNWKPREPHAAYHYTPLCVAQSFNSQYCGNWYTLTCVRQLPYLCQKKVYIVPITDVPNVPPKNLSPCEAGWTLYEQHCFQLQENQLMWREASARCKGMGGYLSSIHSVEQNDFFEEITKKTGKVYWWTGLHDHEVDGTFVWDDGTVVDYTNWRPSHPRGFYRTSGGNCVAQAFVHGSADHGMWYVMECNRKLYSMCQRKITGSTNTSTELDVSTVTRSVITSTGLDVSTVTTSVAINTESVVETGFISVTAHAVTLTIVIIFMAFLGALLYCKRSWIEDKRSKVATIFFKKTERAAEPTTELIIEPEAAR